MVFLVYWLGFGLKCGPTAGHYKSGLEAQAEKGSFFPIGQIDSRAPRPAAMHAGMSRVVIPRLRLVSQETSGGGMATAGRIEWSRPASPGNRGEPSPIRQTMSRPWQGMSRPMSRRGLAVSRPLFPTPGKRNKLAFRAIGKRNLYARAHRPQMQSGCVLRYDSRQATFRGSK